MRNFIKLTIAKTCREILIDASKIIFVRDDNDTRHVYLSNDCECDVKETIDEIEKLINNAGICF